MTRLLLLLVHRLLIGVKRFLNDNSLSSTTILLQDKVVLLGLLGLLWLSQGINIRSRNSVRQTRLDKLVGILILLVVEHLFIMTSHVVMIMSVGGH